MRELSRVNLFTWTRNLLAENNSNDPKRSAIRDVALKILTRDNLNPASFGNGNIDQADMQRLQERRANEMIDILDYNIKVLTGIEELFLVDNFHGELPAFPMSEGRKEVILSRYTPTRNKKNMDKTDEEIFRSNTRFKHVFDDTKNSYERFEHLLNFLNDYSNKGLKDTNVIEEPEAFVRSQDIRITKKIFVSHAYEDKLYTFGLFLYLLEKEILAYVDWIFSPAYGYGGDIKSNLSRHIYEAEQLLFIRSNNSELRVMINPNKNSNKFDIKGWCAWEIGEYYYHKHYEENRTGDQFFLKLYSDLKKETFTEEKRDIKILDDLQALNQITGGALGA